MAQPVLQSGKATVQPLWQPSSERIGRTNMLCFFEQVNRNQGTTFSSYDELYDWSASELSAFWSEFWAYAGIIVSQPYDEVIDDARGAVVSRGTVQLCRKPAALSG
ncbi:MAG: hypothetical protein AB7U29_14280 [Desulfobulbus sp.]